MKPEKKYSISVILPVFNGIKYLADSINSVLKQSYTSFEFIILDDCSTDGSVEFLKTIADDRVKLYLNKENKGLFNSLNFLIEHSGGDLIKLWAQDDIMYGHCIQSIVDFHEQHPGLGFSYTGRDYIDDAGAICPWDGNADKTPLVVYRPLHTRIAFSTGSIAGNIANVTINRKAIEKVGLFNARMKISGDFDMWVRLAEYFPIGFINQPLIQLRNHQDQLSRKYEYYIYHLKEDIISYNYLFAYSTESERIEGRGLLRNYKLVFYFTLMLKSLLKGHLKTTWAFFKTLQSFDNIGILGFYFVRNKLILRRKGIQLNVVNEPFRYPN